LDTFVGLDVLERAAAEFDTLISGAVAQLREIKKKEKGTKNVRFVLAMFVDACRLRREKIRNTVSARQLAEHKRGVGGTVPMKDVHNQDQQRKLNEANLHLTKMLQKVREEKAYNIFTRSLQDSLVECIECKLQLHETQKQFLSAHGGAAADITAPALMVLKERWAALKKFSIYSLYQEFQQRPTGRQTFSSDEGLLTYLAHNSDAKIDQIINADRDKIISRDMLVPQLCYDILLENAELRKMCNTYQLKVLVGKQKGGGAGAR
jgi:transcriptional regulator CtsR